MLEDGEGRALPELKLKLEDSSKAAYLRVVEEIVEERYIRTSETLHRVGMPHTGQRR